MTGLDLSVISMDDIITMLKNNPRVCGAAAKIIFPEGGKFVNAIVKDLEMRQIKERLERIEKKIDALGAKL